jgi:hypothetical protein
MEAEIRHDVEDSMGGVMVAWNELEKMGVFIMELTY